MATKYLNTTTKKNQKIGMFNPKDGAEKIRCKYCGSDNIRLAGTVNGGNQRYRCKECRKSFTITDRKYSNEFKLEVIKRYLDNHGIRNIEQRMNVNSRMVVYWLQQFRKILKEVLGNIEIPENLKDVEIIEINRLENRELAEVLAKTNPSVRKLIDERHTAQQENENEYALLLSENKIRLLIFK